MPSLRAMWRGKTYHFSHPTVYWQLKLFVIPGGHVVSFSAGSKWGSWRALRAENWRMVCHTNKSSKMLPLLIACSRLRDSRVRWIEKAQTQKLKREESGERRGPPRYLFRSLIFLVPWNMTVRRSFECNIAIKETTKQFSDIGSYIYIFTCTRNHFWGLQHSQFKGNC